MKPFIARPTTILLRKTLVDRPKRAPAERPRGRATNFTNAATTLCSASAAGIEPEAQQTVIGLTAVLFELAAQDQNATITRRRKNASIASS